MGAGVSTSYFVSICFDCETNPQTKSIDLIYWLLNWSLYYDLILDDC